MILRLLSNCPVAGVVLSWAQAVASTSAPELDLASNRRSMGTSQLLLLHRNIGATSVNSNAVYPQPDKNCSWQQQLHCFAVAGDVLRALSSPVHYAEEHRHSKESLRGITTPTGLLTE